MKSIYYLIDPETNDVKYVGQSLDPHKRARQHVLESKRQKSEKEKWLFALIQRGILPIVEIAENIPDATKKEDAYLIEKKHQLLHIETITNQLIAGEGQFSTVEFYRRKGRVRLKNEGKEKPRKNLENGST